MSEMLGNHYFLIRDYEAATAQLEEALLHDPDNWAIKKKLIICYTRMLQFDKAIDRVIEILDVDVTIIASTDIEFENCPCVELINEFINVRKSFTDEYEFHMSLGILWMYCNISESTKHFTAALGSTRYKTKIKKILSKLLLVHN